MPAQFNNFFSSVLRKALPYLASFSFLIFAIILNGTDYQYGVGAIAVIGAFVAWKAFHKTFKSWKFWIIYCACFLLAFFRGALWK